MQKLFNKILVPVDFSEKSKKAVEKAADIAIQYQCSLHLLHVVTVSPFAAMAMAEGHTAMSYPMYENTAGLISQLKQLCSGLQLPGNGDIAIGYSVQSGTWDEAIIDITNENGFDLIIIGQKGNVLGKRKMHLNPDKIAVNTNIPVITIPFNRRLTELYSVVIPITDFLPVRKLMYGIYIASKYTTTIKLLGIDDGKNVDKVNYYLQKAYQLIRDNCNVKVELKTVESYNVAEAVNQFAMQNEADLIIVNPGTQTRMHGFFASVLGNIIQKYTAPPVLTVNAV